MYEHLHAADQNRRQDLHLLQAAHQNLGVHLMRELCLPPVDLTRHLAQARTQILEELHQILHHFDHLGNGQIVQHAFAFAHDLAHLGLIEAQQQRRSALQNAARSLDQLLARRTAERIAGQHCGGLLQQLGGGLDAHQRHGHVLFEDVIVRVVDGVLADGHQIGDRLGDGAHGQTEVGHGVAIFGLFVQDDEPRDLSAEDGAER